MNSTAQQPQFRYTQPPSKVLHLRNLPWECSEEELIQLCKPFGKIINTKCNVGANRNQAFVEFADLNQAISMVSYYASSSEPAQIRSKTVYLQYSNRQEIVNNKSPGDVPSNVLLVTFEGVEAGDVSIDVLHLVFSAFGFVHKIATFEKTAGFQALVQFSDTDTASSARSALDGRSIPRYLLPDHVGTCHLHITFSAHVDLTVKFQSHRSRDYTNPNLPVAPSAIDASGQLGGADGKRIEPESNVLLASIENMQYNVTLEVLHTIFSAFGFVQKIAMFEKNAGLQALIQYKDITAAVTAKEALEGHCIYEGGFCKLHLTYSRHTDLSVKANNDRSRDYTIPDVGLLQMHPSVLGPQPSGLLMPSASITNNKIGDLAQQQSGEAVGGNMSNAPLASAQVSNSMYGVPFASPIMGSPGGVLQPGYGALGHPPSQPPIFSGPSYSAPANTGSEFAQPPSFQQLSHYLPPGQGGSSGLEFAQPPAFQQPSHYLPPPSQGSSGLEFAQLPTFQQPPYHLQTAQGSSVFYM